MSVTINPAYVELWYSGGATNTAAASSYGGAISTDAGSTSSGIAYVGGGMIKAKKLTRDASTANWIGGSGCVELIDAPGSANGAGTLIFTASGQTLKWAPYGDTAGAAVAVGGLASGDRVTLTGASGTGQIYVKYVGGSWPVSNASETVTVANATLADGTRPSGLFPDVTAAQSFAGQTLYRVFYVKNAHGTGSIYACKPWFAAQPVNANAHLAIGVYSAKNVAAATPANDATAPSNVTFSAPAQGTLDMGQLDPGEYRAVHIRRIIDSGTLTATAADYSTLQIDATIG